MSLKTIMEENEKMFDEEFADVIDLTKDDGEYHIFLPNPDKVKYNIHYKDEIKYFPRSSQLRLLEGVREMVEKKKKSEWVDEGEIKNAHDDGYNQALEDILTELNIK